MMRRRGPLFLTFWAVLAVAALAPARISGAPACRPKGALCGGTNGACCAGLACPQSGASKNHCTPEVGQAVGLPPASHATYRDVSLKVGRTGGDSFNFGAFFQWYRGRTANQLDRDDMQETLVGRVLPDAIAFGEAMGAPCASAVKYGYGQLSVISARLGPEYEDKALCKGNDPGCVNGGSVWTIQINGHHYSIPQFVLVRVRQCALDNAAACGAQPLMTANRADALDIGKRAGACGGLAWFDVPTPTEPWSAAVAQSGAIDTRQPQRPLTANELRLADQIHACHAAGMKWHITGDPADRPTCNGDELKLALEQSATTLTRRHFLHLMPFSGRDCTARNGCANGWSDTEIEFWATLQHDKHTLWFNALAVGNWGLSRAHERDHQNTHLCANLPRTSTFKVRIYCGTYIGRCQPVTCLEFLLGAMTNG